MTLHLVVVTAGLSQPSSSRLLADRLVDATRRAPALEGRPVEVEVVELREWAHDLTDQLLTGFAAPPLRALLTRVVAADALIAVSPIFSASYSGLFKTFFDVLAPEALTGTPVLVAATGGSARHSLALDHALRPLFAYLKAAVAPTGVYAAPEDWASEGELTARIDRAAGELARLMRPSLPAAGGVANRPPAAAAELEVVPFGRLLAAQRAATPQQR